MLHRKRACKYDVLCCTWPANILHRACTYAAQGHGDIAKLYRAYNSDAQQGLRIWCGLQICCTGPANMLHKTSKYGAQGL